MQTDEHVGVVRFRKRDAVGKRDIRVIRAREKNLPAVGGEQGLNAARPVERKFFFKPSIHQTVRADVCTTVARIEDEDAVGAEF